MKEKYLAPYIREEELEKSDVLLASDETQSIEENQTKSFAQFIFSGDWWS